MRLGKLRGTTSTDAMPIGPFRTYTQPVNIRDLDRFDAGDEVTPETLVEKRLIKNTRNDVKLLGVGELTKKLTVSRPRDLRRRRARRSRQPAAPSSCCASRRCKKVRHHKAKPSPPKSPTAAADGAARGGRRRGPGRGAPQRPAREPRSSACSPGSPTRGVSPSYAGACSSRPAVLAVYRLGSWIPAPGVDQRRWQQFFGTGKGSSGVLSLLNLFSGSALSRFSLFALGIMPYVTASIIFQLMAVVVPSLERLQKEGEAGYAKITQYTRYLTVALAAAQSTGYAFLFKQSGVLTNVNTGRLIIIIVTLTGGTTMLMWMGEQITKRGIGNGISIIIFASILAYAPAGISGWINGDTTARLFFPLIALGIVVSVVYVMEGQRRIPIQYARRQLGNRQTTGGSTYMPLSIIMAGVIPIIFAAAILAVPQTIGSFQVSWSNWISTNFGYTSWKYLLVEAILIIMFTFFYTSVVFNPVDQADNLRKYNGYIPGIRPGPPTAAYLDRVLNRLTLPGRAFPRGRRRRAVGLHLALPLLAGDLPRPRRHVGPHRRRRRAPDHAADGVADGHAPLRRVLTL